MNVDDRIAQIRERRSQLPDSRAGAEIRRLGLEDDALAHLQRLETAVCSLVAAFDGELDDVQPESVNWLSYVAEKAEHAGKAANRIRVLFDFADVAGDA